MFDKLIKTAISVATLPVSLAADKTGIPMLLDKKGRTATQRNVKEAVDSIMDLLD